MVKILPIASGSTGNCMLVEIDGRVIIIDLGVTAKMMKAALEKNSYSWNDIHAVLITHTHSDHIKGLEVCMKHISAPIFMSHTSKDMLMLEQAVALTYYERTEILPGLWVTAIRTSHDCPGSIGFKIETEQNSFGYVTDLGVIPESTIDLISGADCIVIESNHDEEMLRYGRYPAFLKKRILSDQGHLSNDACAEAIVQLAERGTKNFYLAHLSQENNRPEIALDCAQKATAGMDLQIEVLPVYGDLLTDIKKSNNVMTQAIL